MIKRAKVKILLGNFIDTFLEIDGVNYPAREIVLTQRIEENGPVTRLKLTRCFNSEGVFTPDLFGRPIVEEFIASPLIIATDKREFDTTTTLHEQRHRPTNELAGLPLRKKSRGVWQGDSSP